MATSETSTCRDICTAALYKIGVTTLGQTPSARDINVARDNLNRMLKSWQNTGPNLWTTSGMSIAVAASATQTLSPVRPLSIHSCRYKNTSGTELPMVKLNRAEYDRLPNKATTGTPVQFYYDRQRENAVFYVWPVPNVSGTFEITYTREQEDIDLDDALDLPGEWYDCVVYGLAARLLDEYGLDNPKVIARAEDEMFKAQAFDREDSTFFVDAEYRF